MSPNGVIIGENIKPYYNIVKTPRGFSDSAAASSFLLPPRAYMLNIGYILPCINTKYSTTVAVSPYY